MTIRSPLLALPLAAVVALARPASAAVPDFHPFDSTQTPQLKPVVSLIRVGDDELRSQAFRLRRAAEVRIHALGEGRNELSDYAWILDAGTRRRVWTMIWSETRDAGGSDKNRLFDGNIKLPAGNYILYYVSDGSHSFGNWNSSPPAEPENWGVTLFPASSRDAGAFAPFESPRVDVLAELLRVRSNRDWHSTFVLEKPTLVRIHAIGEASGNEIVDRGWIEDGKTGRTVWEMSYATTEHAGGGEKNRLYDGTIRLPPGRYRLHFKTDDSHSYGDWNTDPPDDPDSWGIAVYRVQN